MSEAILEEDRTLSFIESQMNSEWSDGLPVVPPTQAAVDSFIRCSGLDGAEILGEFRPRQSVATVRDVAVNAIMAGCRPEYAPVVVALARALMDEEYDVWGVSCSTKGSASLVIVNGPVRNAIEINCGTNVFGPGRRANATIGRTVQLMVLNLGGARAGELDKATLGHPGRFSYCIGEDEENSPWTPLHVERGLSPTDSAVTVFGGEGLRLVNVHHNTADAVLTAIVDTLASPSIYNAHNIIGRSQHVLVFAKEHRDLLWNAGWTKQLIREYVAENAVISEELLRRVGGTAEGAESVVQSPDDLLIVAAGGGAGRFAGVIPGWSWQSQAVTVKV